MQIFLQLVFLLISYNSSSQEAKPSKLNKKRSYYIVGDFIQDFKLKNIDGRMVSLADYKSQKGLIIVFMKNTCEYCQAYEGRIKMLAQKYGPLGYPLIAISPFGDDHKNSPLDDLPHMKILANREKFTFPYLSDEKFKMTTLFDDEYTPTAYVLQNIQGKMKLLYKGDIDNDWENAHSNRKRYVEHSLDSLRLAEKNDLTRKQNLDKNSADQKKR